MTTPEGKVKAKVKRMLAEFGERIYYHMPVQNGMGEMTLDFIGCAGSMFFAIETKAEGAKPTLRQMATMGRMKKAGAHVFLVNDDWSLELCRAHLELFAR